MPTTFADRIITFNNQLDFKGPLPEGINIMNPFKESPNAAISSAAFYEKYYNDNYPRHMILGINPGRFGSAMTGISFTDPKRLKSHCNIPFSGQVTHEPSSEFIYDMITAFSGVTEFYKRFYINSVCPLGFTTAGKSGKEVNYNYYDSKALLTAVYGFIVKNIQEQINLGFETDVCFCFGTGKNEAFLRKLNDEKKFFNKIVALEHPRYVMQYKSKLKSHFISKYLEALTN